MKSRKYTAGMRRRVACSLFAGLFVVSAFGAGPLKIEVRPFATQPRPAGPEWVEVRLTSAAAHLVEGVLELNIVDDGATSSVFRTQELALTTGPRVFRLLLPTPPRSAFGLDRDVHARFIAQNSAFDLGRFPLHTRGRVAHSLVLAVGRATLRVDDAATRLWQSLRPERFAPKNTVGSLESIATTPVFIEAEDFPTDPLTYCAFDAVMLEPEVFGRLKERSLAALGQWLGAGGSVALFAPASLDGAHVELLRGWLASDPETKRFEFEFDLDGRLQTRGGEPILARVGLGRLAIFLRRPETADEVDTPQWRRAAAFLWKIRSDRALAIEQTGQWTLPDRTALRNESYERAQIASELTQALLPDTVRVIPLPLIIAILAAFIIVVGPVDYLLLGKLRLRKFTWIVFPLVSVAFTVLTMKLASHYLGTNTHHGVFVLTDLGGDGRALRETRFELTLPPRPETLVRETQHAFVTPISGIDFENESRRDPATFEGQFPARYTYRFPGQQWTPHLRRVLSISGATDESRVNWSAFAGWQHDPQTAINAIRGESGCTFVILEGGHVRSDTPGPLSNQLLTQITFPMNVGFHAIVPWISPTSAGSFDDLAMIERDGGTVVIAIRREGRDLYAWRKLYP